MTLNDDNHTQITPNFTFWFFLRKVRVFKFYTLLGHVKC